MGHSVPGPLLLMGEKGSLLYELNCRLDQLRKVMARVRSGIDFGLGRAAMTDIP